MIPRMLGRLLQGLTLCGLIVFSFWLIGFLMPYYNIRNSFDVRASQRIVFGRWTDLRSGGEWNTRLTKIRAPFPWRMTGRDSADVDETWTVVEVFPPDSLVLLSVRDEVHMQHRIRVEALDSAHSRVRRTVRVFPHGAWFDSWFFFIKSRYESDVYRDDDDLRAFVERGG